MIENIKRIGLFMIVAQTVIHFAAGQQYEKYMRIVAGVIVLLLFITPFSSYRGNAAEEWQKELEQITEKMESYGNLWPEKMPDMDYGSERSMMRQLESEVKRKLIDGTDLAEYEITDVAIEWEGVEGRSGSVQDMLVGGIRITLWPTAEYEDITADKETEIPIVIERIQIGKQPGTDEPETENAEQIRQLQEYRGIFAEILGIDEEKVEVIYDGRG